MLRMINNDIIYVQHNKYEYDQFDRIIKVDYGNGNVETRAYDSWGKLIALNKNGKKINFQI